MNESHYSALFRRSSDSLALRSGILPGDFCLELDRRRVANQTARGMYKNGLSFLRSDVAKRYEKTVIELPDKPTPQQIAAAYKGRDSRDRWIKLVAIRQQYSEGELAVAFKRTGQVTNDYINTAKRHIKGFDEWDELKAQGQTAGQAYVPPPLLEPGAVLYNILPGKSAGDAIVISISPTKSPKRVRAPKQMASPTKATSAMTVASLLDTKSPSAKFDSGASSSDDYVAPVRLVSVRVRRALYRLPDRLVAFQPKLSPLDHIAYHLEPSLETMNYDSDSDRVADESCETAASLAEYRAFAASYDVLAQYDTEEIAACIVWAIDGWFDHVNRGEQNDTPL